MRALLKCNLYVLSLELTYKTHMYQFHNRRITGSRYAVLGMVFLVIWNILFFNLWNFIFRVKVTLCFRTKIPLMAKFHELGYELLSYAPYYPDLATATHREFFYLFSDFKRMLWYFSVYFVGEKIFKNEGCEKFGF